MQEQLKNRAIELLREKTVNRVLGWKKGEFAYDVTPAVFNTEQDLNRDFIYDDFCSINLSKYLVKESRKEGKILVFLKPCDSYSYNRLLKEHRVLKENVYVIAIECGEKADPEKIKGKGISGITGISSEGDKYIIKSVYGDRSINKEDVTADKCIKCKSKKHLLYDELIGAQGEETDVDRFEEVKKIEAMTTSERFEFWRENLSKCIRCNACRNICPACTCEKCVFDNDNSGIANKAAANSFEENMFHIIRLFHVAGRCTDCGECSRVCPQHIPLYLLNGKVIKDINEIYGEHEDMDIAAPDALTHYKKEDPDPSIVNERGTN